MLRGNMVNTPKWGSSMSRKTRDPRDTFSFGDVVGSRRQVLKSLSAAAVGVLSTPIILRAATPEILKLTQIESLTGPSSSYGIRAAGGSQYAVDEINTAGGFTDTKGVTRKLAIVADDMASDAAQAVTLFRQHALSPDVVAQVGPVNSTGFIPLVPLARQMKLMIVGHAAAPIKAWNPWAYRVNPISDTTTPIFLKKLSGLLPMERVSLLFDQTQEGQVADANVVRRESETLGYKIVSQDAFKGGDQDFSPQIANLKAANPQIVFVAAAVADGVRIVNQLQGVGLMPPLITGYGSFLDPLYWDGTNGSIKGRAYTWIPQDIQGASGALKTFLQNYNTKNKLEATAYSTYGYDSVYSVVECIKRAASGQRDAICEVMSSLDFHSPLGSHITFKNPPTGENQTPSANTIRVTGRGLYQLV